MRWVEDLGVASPTQGWFAGIVPQPVNDPIAPAISGRLRFPAGVALDSQGNLYIGDAATNRIRKLVASTGQLTTIAGPGGGCDYGSIGSMGEAGDGGPATDARLNRPLGVAADANGNNVYFADSWNNRVRVVANGIMQPVAGTGWCGTEIDPTDAQNTPLCRPSGVALDTGHNLLYIADTNNDRVVKVDLNNTPNPAAVVPEPTGGWSPSGLAVSSAGDLYVADRKTNGRIVELVYGTTIPTEVVTGINLPDAVAVDSSGLVYYTDAYAVDLPSGSQGAARVRVTNTSTHVTSTVAGVSPPGNPPHIDGFDGDGALGSNAVLSWPHGLVADSSGSVFIADSYNNRIRKATKTLGLLACNYSGSPLHFDALGTGATGLSVVVTPAPSAGCPWSAMANDAWITITGVTSATVTFNVAAAGSPRTGSLAVAGQLVTISQAGQCSMSVPTTPYPFGAAGGSGDIPVTAAPGCSWSATSADSWAAISGGANGTGSGNIQFTVAPNQTCAPRTTTIGLGSGIQATITQSALYPMIGVFRHGTWIFDSNFNGQLDGGDQVSGNFGTAGDYPFFQPWSWDSYSTQAKAAVFRNGPGIWFFDRDASGDWTYPDDPSMLFGGSTDMPVVGDWTGVGKASVGVFRTSAGFGQWYLDLNKNVTYNGSSTDLYFEGFGQSGDQPVAGDWDHSGNVRVGLFRPSTGGWALRMSPLFGTSLPSYSSINNFGTTGDIAVAGDWNGDGKTKIGVFRNGKWYLDCKGSGIWGGPGVLTYQFGTTGDYPFVAGTATVPQSARFVPVTPCRVADTRNANGPFGGPMMGGGHTRSFAVPVSSCNIPATASAYSLNVTVVPTGPLSYLTMWPTGQAQPFVSTLNSLEGKVLANAAIVPAGYNGSIDVYVTDDTHVILDVNGYFDPTNSAALPFFGLTPCRVADTRHGVGTFGGPVMAGGETRSFPIPSSNCSIPATAQAYSLNTTVVPQTGLGYLTMFPSGQPQPPVSTLNSYDGRIVANAAIVPAGMSGAVSVYVTDPTHVVLDANGYFGTTGTGTPLSFYPVTPCRIADTRNPAGPFGGPALGAAQSRSFAVPQSSCNIPSTAKAYSLNVTVVPLGLLGYLSIWPSDQSQPLVSTLNSPLGSIVANAALVPASASGAVSVYVSDASHVILDINGYFAP